MRLLISLVFYIPFVALQEYDSYSYQKFKGPVSGQIQEITVPSTYYQNQQTLDYVAKPDYLYNYGIEDPSSGTSHLHKESRDGDAVLGEYKVLQPDGLLRIVKYTADAKNGFVASVEYVKL